MPPADSTDWRDALRDLAGEIRGIILRHPAAAPLLVSRPVMPTRRLEQLDAYARLLQRAGFTEDRATEVLRNVFHVRARARAHRGMLRLLRRVRSLA